MKFTNFIKTSIPVSTLSKYNLSELFPIKDIVLDKEQYNKRKEEEIKHQILNYEPNSSKGFRFQDDFLQNTRSLISRELNNRGLDDRYTDHILAQVALESDFGRSESGRNNYSGIKGKGTKRNTKEYIDGQYKDITDEFKDYESREAWMKDYIDLLTNSRYGHAFNLPEDQFIPYIHKQGYATDPEYVNKVHKIYDQITRMDDGGEMTIDNDDEPETYKKYKKKWDGPEIQYGSEEQLIDFITRHESYKNEAYLDKAKGGIYTVGYGNTYLYDKKGKPIRRVNKYDKLSKEEAIQQLQYHLNADIEKIKKRFPNFDKFPDGVKYALREGLYNIGETEMFNPKYQFPKLLKKYNDSNDFENYDMIKELMLAFDWNRDTAGNIGLRSGRRRAMMQGLYDWNDNSNINKFTSKNYNRNVYWQWGKDILIPITPEEKKKKKTADNTFYVKGNKLK